MSYKVSEQGNISTVFLTGEIDMDVADKAKGIILPLVESGKEVHINLCLLYTSPSPRDS